MFTPSRLRGVSFLQAFSQAGGNSKPGIVMGMLLTAVPSLGKVIGESAIPQVLIGVIASLQRRSKQKASRK